MNLPPVLFGIETEVGITRDDAPDLDVVAESIALVRSAASAGVQMRWDYACENPHRDMRGFEVDELRQDTDEANYVEQDTRRELSFVEIKSDVVLSNGARFYNDHAHPEYCTPECSTLDELAAQDRAGERIMAACAQALSEQRGSTVRLYKNNTDFRGHSYGCHENYLVPRGLPWNTLAKSVQAFLVTRQVFAGAGKFAVENEDRFVGPGFQIAQRSDFFTELQSVDTMQRRPIVNTRDEPHANPALYRRFHVIIGDANMSPFATRLKVGTTALVLEALARNPALNAPTLAAPLKALREISRDTSWRWPVRLSGGVASSALDVQRAYIELARAHCEIDAAWKEWTLAEWSRALDDLAVDPMRCADRLDWVAKLKLIREFQKANDVADDDPWLQSLDLEYSRLDPAEGLFYGLEQAGSFIGTPPEADVTHAVTHPPETTRAWIRGLCVRKFGKLVESAQWDHVTLRDGDDVLKLSLLDAFDPELLQKLADAINASATPAELEKRLKG